MCGIAGWLRLGPATTDVRQYTPRLAAALEALARRGPDARGTFTDERVLLGHNRLSILDVSAAANQPFEDPTGRYVIAFNGEIFNYRELATELLQAGVQLRTTSDTEVLLHLFIRHGVGCLPRLNGFFAFVVYDRQTGEATLVRDRMGVKPLLYYHDDHRLVFASELKGLLPFGIPKVLDPDSVYQFFQLSYVAPNRSIFKGVRKLRGGCYLQIRNGQVAEPQTFYQIPRVNLQGYRTSEEDYAEKQKKLVELLDAAVARRLISDVPIGVFLSGGIDSSVVAALAARHTPHLNTFSIGFHDPLYDETHYAEKVAARYKTNHTVFRLSFDEMAGHLEDILAYIDEPFADSSAINVYILTQYTRRHATVALSGDGADELFAGYSKHIGEFRARERSVLNTLLGIPGVAGAGGALLPAGRDSKLGRKLWQLKKYMAGQRLSPPERYYQWCQSSDDATVDALLRYHSTPRHLAGQEYMDYVRTIPDFNGVLYADMHLVLQGDMLTKVDLMSMANALEVRTPFLDYTVVDFAFGLPEAYKINAHQRKRIVQDAFRNHLPPELYHRPKQGFEVPLRNWFLTTLRPYIETHVVNPELLAAQGIFHPQGVAQLWSRIQRGASGKDDWTLWSLIVFQSCWNRYLT
jgi:asparagine synthase (glutamine-hydrolysing)